MDAAQWWIFLPACIGMNFFPGPNNLIALIHGTRTTLLKSFIAGLARLPVMVVMLFLLAIGLEALLALSENAFYVMRFIGAGYLLYMAWQSLRAHVNLNAVDAKEIGILAMARSEALVASTNPKLILIFTAFFPQFMDPKGDIPAQVSLMGATFIVIEAGAILFYAGGGRWLQKKLTDEKNTKWLARFTATALTAAACLILIP
ncbi:LysE family translocator [Marinobacterium sp. LSUCC0821]|jgi:threonine/homoserine/homoserine lactone efflux protein|uniref:LysE family translocator n=1 Tax=Marinobacterium sp. LSUCC0821 TaxID=2668067 RepID=UPI001451753C|nr:LysE family translocator [Marinobacterium sp. LSUCC0821]QJD71895.1 LysE family translocator [Marinobacterium sp. LSUCC0821]